MQATQQQAARIIELLESIDASLKRKNALKAAREFKQSDIACNEYMKAINENFSRLAGRRLTATEIAEIIGKPYSGKNHADRIAMGAALTSENVRRGKSGSTRFYVFREIGTSSE